MRLVTTLILTSATLLAGCESFLGEPAKATSIEIAPDSVILAEFESVPIKAVVFDSKGGVMPDARVDWVSHNMTVAFVDSYLGNLMAGRAGTTIIEAHAGNVVTYATVTVTPAVVKTVNAYPNRFVIMPGQRMQLYANPQDEKGRQLQYRVVSFVSKNDRATVTSDGLVTGVAPGLGVITVSVESVSFDVLLRVSEPTASFEFYKRGGTTTAGTATLTFAPSSINNGTLAIDGKSVPVYPAVSYDAGVTCMSSPFAGSPGPDNITGCAFDATPMTIRLCTAANGSGTPGQLQYVLLPANDTGRVASTASAMLAAVQANWNGITVHSACGPTFVPPSTGAAPPRWMRNAPDTNYFRWPDLTTVHTAASVAALLEGAVIYKRPIATIPSHYVAIRVSPTAFEVWH
jgi:hypothetical protein